MHILPREVDPLVFNMLTEDPGAVTYSCRFPLRVDGYSLSYSSFYFLLLSAFIFLFFFLSLLLLFLLLPVSLFVSFVAA